MRQNLKIINKQDNSQTFILKLSFLETLEGFKLKGYVPEDDDMSSGVSILNGIDLAYRKSKTMLKKGISKELNNKLKKYYGLKGKKAHDFLAKNPLILNEDEGNEIGSIFTVGYLKLCIKELKKADLTFFDLANIKWTIPTIVFSRMWQDSWSKFVKGNPSFTNSLQSFDIQLIHDKTEKFYSKGKFANRLKKEAQFLLTGKEPKKSSLKEIII